MTLPLDWTIKSYLIFTSISFLINKCINQFAVAQLNDQKLQLSKEFITKSQIFFYYIDVSFV